MLLSVVVTIVDAGDALERCLTALAAQRYAPPLEIIVPWDDSVPAVAALADRFPACQFLRMGAVRTARPTTGAAGQHELFDRRRSAGLRAATGDVIAILEDRGVPRPDWAEMMAQAHARLPNTAIGGAIENGHDALLNWAVYFCDFGRYHLPFVAGPRQWISDVNIGYKRAALETTREVWSDRYHETTVHWALQRVGEHLFLTPNVVVDQMRGRVRLSDLIRERVAWGRLFAYTRAREATTGKRIALTLIAPLLPIVLLARHTRVQFSKRNTFGTFLRASPAVLLLLAAWSLGEAVGYITAEP